LIVPVETTYGIVVTIPKISKNNTYYSRVGGNPELDYCLSRAHRDYPVVRE
jgi:hypothetical protein